MRGELGIEAIDYKNEDVLARLGEACSDRINVVFDNVGGEILDAALTNIAAHARIVLCGTMSIMNDFERRPGIRNHVFLIIQRATMRGFLVFDYLGRAPQALAELAAWAGEGKLKNQVDVVEGLENAPNALRRLFTGENLGKQLIKIADP